MASKVQDDTTTFKPIGPIAKNIVRRLQSKRSAAEKEAARG